MDPVWSLFDAFEQALDPEERHERGAHFTREADIARIIGPTIVNPWQERIARIHTLDDAERVTAQMRAYHVLDPACGCGNFLYVAVREMKRLEVTILIEGEEPRVEVLHRPRVRILQAKPAR